MTDHNKILSRVKKMFAIANDAAATEHERDTALKMAHNLLAKHNLSMADLPADQNNEAREEQSFVMSVDKWARTLSNSVAGLFFCSYYFTRTGTSGKDGHHFIGRQSNVVTASYMADYLIRSIRREATKRYRSPTSPDGRSFCVGAVNAIRRRVEELKAQDVEATPGTALVLASVYKLEHDANENWMVQNGIITRTEKGRKDNSLTGAFHDGRAFGKTVSLNQQVGATAAPKRTMLN